MALVSSRGPIIGVTAYRERAAMGVWDTEAVFLPLNYMHAITNAGGTAVVLPPQEASPEAVRAVLDRIDGLAVSGGYDVNPERYGRLRGAHTDEPRDVRDHWELELLKAARELDMPVLGVCRGAQLLNVSRGGTLIQHLPDVVGSTRHQGSNGVFASVPVAVEPSSKLAQFHDASRAVPVYHHQAIEDLGEGLVVSAYSDDGVIEAIEDPTMTFCLTTQWHPEQDPAGSGRLYEAFVAASRDYASRR